MNQLVLGGWFDNSAQISEMEAGRENAWATFRRAGTHGIRAEKADVLQCVVRIIGCSGTQPPPMPIVGRAPDGPWLPLGKALVLKDFEAQQDI